MLHAIPRPKSQKPAPKTHFTAWRVTAAVRDALSDSNSKVKNSIVSKNLKVG
jgi:hypothetical protein